MDGFKKQYGDWGLVAGAAEGLGAAFCRVLAGWGLNIIMVDVDSVKMNKTAGELESSFGIVTKRITADLSKVENIEAIISESKEFGCRLMIYNAAYGPVKEFLENTTKELDYYVDLNSRTPLHLIYRFLKSLPKGKRGGILVMSSLAGLWGTQLVVPYGATKAFDYNLAEGLHYELKDRKIDVMACCAGATDTPNYRSTKPKKNLLGPSILNPDYVAERALRKLGKRALYIPGLSNQLTYFFLTRVFPRSFSTGMMNRVMSKMYRD
jgi:short-subunit dehydrogenase